MIKQNNVAIIPARMGSVRIKFKNIKKFNSKPMIEWAFRILKKSKIFNKVVLTSENDKILKLGKKLGFDVLIKRPLHLADNYTGTSEVIKHAIEKIDKLEKIDNICCVYPCNPFITIKDLKNSLKLLKNNKNLFVFPITNYSHPIERAYKIKNREEITFVNKDYSNTRTQDIQEKFYDAGQFYFATKKTWLNFERAKKAGLKIPNWRVVDIDNHKDWKRAEIMYKFLKNKKILSLI